MQSRSFGPTLRAVLILSVAIGSGCSGTSNPAEPGGAGGNSSSPTGGSSSSSTAAVGGSNGTGGSSSSSTAAVGGSNATGGSTNATSAATGGAGNITTTGGGAAVPTGGGAAVPTGGAGNTTTGGGAAVPTGGAANTSTGGNATGGFSSSGSCDTVTCTGGQVCSAGVCACPTGSSLCSGACMTTADFQTNAANCGKCGTICPTGASCSAGVCACPAGKLACGTACIDPQTDPLHCGTCATSCASGVCTAGVCKKVKNCFTKTTVTTPLVADFETYDGTTAPATWGWAFNAPAGTAGAVYAGLYNSNDGTGTPQMSIIAPGYNSSKYTADISNTMATAWGGQLGMWMGCIDASAFQGISFWVQGTTPTGKANLAVSTEATSAPDATDTAGGGTCIATTAAPCKEASIEFPVSATWSQVLVPWATFTAGAANGATVTTTGNGITGLAWNVSLAYTTPPYTSATPGPYNLAVDNVQFIGNTACGTGLSLCGTGCVDTKTNNANCGTCGTACPSPQTCSAGACQCPTGYTNCNGQCVNTQIDVGNCGACGKSCSGACSAGACTSSSCTANMAQLEYTRTAYATFTQGKYWINNNVWGATGATGWEGIWHTCTSGNTIGWGTDWSWTGAASQVKAYASAVLGWHWGWKLSGTGLPVQLSANKNITCGWTYRVTSSQTIDVSYDLFAHSLSNPGTNDDPTDEIMVWLYRSGGAAPIGATAATATIAGTSWEVHRGNNTRWNVYSYVRSSNATSSTLNLQDFLSDLVTRGWMSGSKYLTSIQAGTEVFLGDGRLDTDSYYCTIQ